MDEYLLQNYNCWTDRWTVIQTDKSVKYIGNRLAAIGSFVLIYER